MGVANRLVNGDVMKNKLVVIGSIGNLNCYLNVPKEMAIARYVYSNFDYYLEDEKNEIINKLINGNSDYDYIIIREFEFDDEFCGYDVYEK